MNTINKTMIQYKPVELKRKVFNKCFSKQNLFHLGRYTTETHNDRRREIDPKRKKNKYKFYTINSLEFDSKELKAVGNWYRDLKGAEQVNLFKQFIETLEIHNKKVYFIELESQIDKDSTPIHWVYKTKTATQLTLPKNYKTRVHNKSQADLGSNTDPFKNPIVLSDKNQKSYFQDKSAIMEHSQVHSNSHSILFDFIYKDIRVVFYKFYTDILISVESSKEGRLVAMELANSFTNLLKDTYDKIPKKLEYNMSFIVTENQSLRLKTKTRESDLQFDNPNFIDKFYNNNVVVFHDKILTDIQNNGKGLYLIHGLPGSGKTSYIEYLTYLLAKNERQVVYLPADNINFFSNPSFSGFALESLKDTVIVIEDAEEILTQSSKRNSATSTLLQLTDGFLSKFINCVIIGTFNTNIDKIDPALKREGRLKDVIEIGELEDSKVEALKKEFDITNDGKTLAKLFNDRDNDYKSQNKKIGF